MIKVSNIERFATHDGPGIRTTVFLKGCYLHCPWCANPETWTVEPVLLHDEKKCVRCQCCKAICPKQAISFSPAFTLDKALCDGCGECVDECLQDALSISGKDMSVEEVVKIIQKDDAYYQTSHGGVTISGGEPFYQFEKTFELLKRLKELSYHTAVETTGMISMEHLVQVEPYVDLFLMDCKHVNAQKLQDTTGASFERINQSLEYILSRDVNKVILRTPVIPGFNRENVEEIIQYAVQKGVKEIDLLPYHPLGKNKWHNLKREYQLEEEKMMDKSELEPYVEYGKGLGIYVKIGG